MTKKIRQKTAKSYDRVAVDYAEEQAKENVSMKSLRPFARRIPEGGRVLDLGCGGGQDSAYLHSQNLRVVGIDISRNMIRYAKRHVKGPVFRVSDFVSSRFRRDSFDAIWCNRVFQHVPIRDQQRFLEKAARILKPGGLLYLSMKIGDTDEDSEVMKGRRGEEFLVKTLGKRTAPRLIKDAGLRVVKKRSWQFMDWWEYVLKKPE